MKAFLRPIRAPTLLPIRMNAAETNASSAMADCTPLTVVSRSRTTAAMDTFINEVSTTRTNIAMASRIASLRFSGGSTGTPASSVIGKIRPCLGAASCGIRRCDNCLDRGEPTGTEQGQHGQQTIGVRGGSADHGGSLPNREDGEAGKDRGDDGTDRAGDADLVRRHPVTPGQRSARFAT